MMHTTRGFTAVEMMITVLIISLLVLLAGPSFQAIFDRQRVRAVAADLSSDIQFARSEAVRLNGPVTVSFSPGTTPWCYGIAAGSAACDCTGTACTIKTVTGTDFKNVSMTPYPNGANGLSIDPRQGRLGAVAGGGSGAMPDYIAFASSTTPAASLRVQLNILGRVAQCSPSGTLAGFPTC
jgi:prepilin-type N-terminal cleavage/methylation domain-containing protein